MLKDSVVTSIIETVENYFYFKVQCNGDYPNMPCFSPTHHEQLAREIRTSKSMALLDKENAAGHLLDAAQYQMQLDQWILNGEMYAMRILPEHMVLPL